MKEMTCIVCPNGCKLEVTNQNGQIMVQGNQCTRGEKFAITELTNPMRTISSTVATVFPKAPALPVKVSGEIPKGEIFHVMNEIHKVFLTEPVGRGDIIIKNVLNLEVDVIATSSVLEDIDKKRLER